VLNRVLRIFHPEGIPWPGSWCYNLFSQAHIFQEHYRLVALDILHFCSQGHVLDVGTGPGWLLVKLNELQPALRLTGADISPAMVEKAKRNLAKAGCSPATAVVLAGARHLPFPDDSIECVASTGSIHHWKQPVESLDEIHRVLQPGGHALLYDIVRDTPQEVLRNLSREFGRLRRWLLWLHAYEEPFYTQEEMLSLARQSVFQAGACRFIGALCRMSMQKSPLGEKRPPGRGSLPGG